MLPPGQPRERPPGRLEGLRNQLFTDEELARRKATDELLAPLLEREQAAMAEVLRRLIEPRDR